MRIDTFRAKLVFFFFFSISKLLTFFFSFIIYFFISKILSLRLIIDYEMWPPHTRCHRVNEYFLKQGACKLQICIFKPCAGLLLVFLFVFLSFKVFFFFVLRLTSFSHIEKHCKSIACWVYVYVCEKWSCNKDAMFANKCSDNFYHLRSFGRHFFLHFILFLYFFRIIVFSFCFLLVIYT